MNSIKRIVSLLLLSLIICGCDSLAVQENYCEIAFAYDIDQPLPEDLQKDLIGCACTIKDILKGKEVGKWQMYPLEKCRRVRGFPPKQWKTVIDPYFQYQSKKFKRN